VLDQHHGPERVGLEGAEGIIVVYLAGRLFGVQDSWDCQGEVEVGGLLRESGGEGRGGVGNGLFVWDV
jgi:hypothetical protein